MKKCNVLTCYKALEELVSELLVSETILDEYLEANPVLSTEAETNSEVLAKAFPWDKTPSGAAEWRRMQRLMIEREKSVRGNAIKSITFLHAIGR